MLAESNRKEPDTPTSLHERNTKQFLTVVLNQRLYISGLEPVLPVDDHAHTLLSHCKPMHRAI